MEACEVRALLSVSSVFNSATGTLSVTSDGADNINVAVTAGQVTVNGDTTNVNAVDVKSLNVMGGSGDNQIDLSAVTAADFSNPNWEGVIIDGGAGSDSIVGSDLRDSIVGGDGNDTVLGGDAQDTILGGAGDDSLRGQSGNDSILGGDGLDTCDGGGGDDIVDGGAGNDLVNGRTGGDTLIGGLDDDTLLGLSGNDSLDGGDGNDSLKGGEGNDTLLGGNGSDNLSGSIGNDTEDGGGDADTVAGGWGNDSLVGGDGNDYVHGDFGLDTIHGNIGDDTLDGGTDADSVSGEEGNDSIIGGTGIDTLVGGDGADTLNKESTDDVTSDANDIFQEFHDGDSDSLPIEPETPTVDIRIKEFTSGGVGLLSQLKLTYEITGDEADPFLIGFFGSADATVDDGDEAGPSLEIDGSEDKPLSVGTHTVTFSGVPYKGLLENLNNKYVLANADVADDVIEIVHEDNNIQNFIGVFHAPPAIGASPLVLRGRDDADSTDDNPADTVDLAVASKKLKVTGTLTPQTLEIASKTVSEVRAVLLGGDDTLRTTKKVRAGIHADAGDGDDSIIGGRGKDELVGGAGDDLLFGSSGSDTLSGGEGDDVINGGSGRDLLRETDVSTNLTLTSSSLTGLGTDELSSIELAQLLGDDSDNQFDARLFKGRTTLDGGDGDDTLLGGTKRDSLLGGDGDDVLLGFAGADSIDGGADNDTAAGGKGKDKFFNVELIDETFVL